MIKLNKEDLELMYSKAKTAFEKCVGDDENKFLANEIDIPINSILTENEFVRIQYFKSETDSYIVETKIQLLSKANEIIGSYIYYENEDGIPVDDSLVFK